MVVRPFLFFLAVSLLRVSPLSAKEGKLFFANGRWLKGDIQIQQGPSGKELVVLALKSGSITLEKSQVKNIVYSVKSSASRRVSTNSPVHGENLLPKTKRVLYSHRVNSQRLDYPYHSSAFESYIQEASAKNQLDPELIKAVIKQESNFNYKNVSRKGAVGLMQLMPETAKKLGVRDIFDPRENIHAGTRYLRSMLEQFNWDIQYALAAYNAGPGAVKKYRAIPPYQETEDYVLKVMSYYQAYLRGNQLFTFLDKKGRLVITDLPYLP